MTDETTTGALPDLDALQRLAEAATLQFRMAVGMLMEAVDVAERNGNEPGMSAMVDQWRAFIAAANAAPGSDAWIAATRALVAERDEAREELELWRDSNWQALEAKGVRRG